MKRKIRVLIGKPGLDGHDRGAKVVAKALKDSGIEVFYTGRHSTAEKIVSQAIEKEVDVIGLSILSGAHLYYSKQVIDLLKGKGVKIPVVVGGIISEKDIPKLKEMGVKEVFPVGSELAKIVESIKDIAGQAEAKKTKE